LEKKENQWFCGLANAKTKTEKRLSSYVNSKALNDASGKKEPPFFLSIRVRH